MKKLLNKLLLRRRLQNSPETAGFAEIERFERIFYLEYLREGMTVFDVGANVGELTLLFSRFVGSGGIVHAFEASGAVFQNLETVCRAAGRSNVALNHLALSDQEGKVRLNVYDAPYSSFNSMAQRPLENYGLDLKPVAVEEVRAATIDDYCAEKKIGSIDLLKIDVEGAEFQVMQGARRMLRSKSIKCLTFEFGQTTFDMGNSAAEIERFLNSFDYRIRNIVARDPVFPGRESVETAKYSMHVAAPD